MRSTTSTIAVAISVAVLAAACGDDGGSDADESSATAGATDPTGTTADGAAGATTNGTGDTGDTAAGCDATAEGSEMTFASYLSPGELDPTLVAGGLVGGTEIAALYDVLFTYNFDNQEVEPHLAESITSNDDFTEYTLTLREEISFSDGTPLDAQMVADNIDRYTADEATAPHGAYLSVIDDKEVVDPLTLRITMSRPWAEFPSYLAEQVGMIVNTNVVGDDLAAFAADPPDAAGVGPYVLERNAPGEEIVLTARDDYWGGPVCTETLRIISIPGGDGTYEAFRNDEVDVAYLRDPAAVAAAVDNGEEGEFVSFDVGTMLLLNHTDGYAASDPRLREAMWLAIDPQVVNERVYQGNLDASMSLLHPESAYSTGDVDSVEYDPERARQLVDEATVDGADATLTIRATPSPPAPEMALTLQGLIAAAGFEVEVDQAQMNETIGAVFEGNFDAALWSYSIPPMQIASRLYASLHSEGTHNLGSYVSAEMDAALEEAMRADAESRADAVAAVGEIYQRDFVSPILGNSREGIIWQPDVEGVVVAPANIFLFHDARRTS